MKKYLALLLALVFCFGCLVGCSNETTDGEGKDEAAATLADAATYIKSLYKDSPKSTPRNYDMPGKVIIGETEFTVTWSVSDEAIKVVASKTAGFWTITVPEKNDTQRPYTLTATVKDADGKTQDVVFDRVLPIIDNGGTTSDLEEGKEYRMFMTQVNVSKVLYATTETQDDKFIKTTEDPSKATLFKAEKVDGGYKLYTEINGVKSYLYAHTTTAEDGKVSKYICYSAENSSVWSYQQKVNAWFTTYEGTTYVLGTYGTYETFCISESSYITEANTGVSQFPAEFISKDKEGPSIEKPDEMTPEEVVDAAYALEIGGTLPGLQTLTGVIVAVNTPYDAGYNNVTVTIVVAGKTDKPIECFRLKGNGADVIAVGDTITVTGSILKYDNKSETGKVEFNSGCTLDSYKSAGNTEGTGATALNGALTDGMQIVIVNVANNKAFSSDPDKDGSYYQKGVDVTINGNAVTGYGDAEIWTVVANDDGTFSFKQGDQKIGMQDQYSSMGMGYANDKWEVIALDGGLYNIKNVARGNFLEWYAAKNNWSTYSNGNEATDALFQMGIYVIG